MILDFMIYKNYIYKNLNTMVKDLTCVQQGRGFKSFRVIMWVSSWHHPCARRHAPNHSLAYNNNRATSIRVVPNYNNGIVGPSRPHNGTNDSTSGGANTWAGTLRSLSHERDGEKRGNRGRRTRSSSGHHNTHQPHPTPHERSILDIFDDA